MTRNQVHELPGQERPRQSHRAGRPKDLGIHWCIRWLLVHKARENNMRWQQQQLKDDYREIAKSLKHIGGKGLGLQTKSVSVILNSHSKPIANHFMFLQSAAPCVNLFNAHNKGVHETIVVCQLDWAKGCTDLWSNIILDVSFNFRAFEDTINI